MKLASDWRTNASRNRSARSSRRRQAGKHLEFYVERSLLTIKLCCEITSTEPALPTCHSLTGSNLVEVVQRLTSITSARDGMSYDRLALTAEADERKNKCADEDCKASLEPDTAVGVARRVSSRHVQKVRTRLSILSGGKKVEVGKDDPTMVAKRKGLGITGPGKVCGSQAECL